MLRPAALVLCAAAVLVGCESSAPVGPPEGWTGTATRWWVPGTDTTAAFRDLETFDAMGVERAPDAFDGWVQEQLLVLYRTNPEVVDSVFTAGVAPTLSPPSGAPDVQAAAATLANDVKRDFYQRYNNAQIAPGAPGLAVPDSLAGVRSETVVQVYVDRDQQPVAVELLQGTGTSLDALAMQHAATTEYTAAWVRPTAGPSAGVRIPTWVRVTQTFE